MPTSVFPWLVVIVMIDVARLEPGVTEGGEKLHVDLFGSPRQESETESGNGAPTALT